MRDRATAASVGLTRRLGERAVEVHMRVVQLDQLDPVELSFWMAGGIERLANIYESHGMEEEDEDDDRYDGLGLGWMCERVTRMWAVRGKPEKQKGTR
jgi:hypothetical protein